MVDKSITMNVNEILEIDYLNEEISDNVVTIKSDPTGNISDKYISKNMYVFDPPKAETYQLEINNQIIEIDVYDIPDSELDHRWPMDEGSGTTVADEVGTMDGTVNGATWVTTGIGAGGYHLDFDGTDDYVTYGSPITSDNETFTVFGWFNPDVLGINASLIGTLDSDNHGMRLSQQSSDEWQFAVRNNGGYKALNGGTVQTDTWFFVAGSHNGGDKQLWVGDVNNAPTKYSNTDESLTTSSRDLQTGVNGVGQYFNGQADQNGFALKELSDQIIDEIYQNTKGDYV